MGSGDPGSWAAGVEVDLDAVTEGGVERRGLTSDMRGGAREGSRM